ncbi:MAG: hypothetical protein E7052_05095 [Lentisphaerae bacterium]|nr:hypothetical protein [Lentisphaerota bacterium]
MLKKICSAAAVFCMVAALSAENLLELKNCRPGIGQAAQPPAMTSENVPGVGDAVVVRPTVKGNYQGLDVFLPEPVAFEDIDTITFKFGQNVRANRTGAGAVVLHFEDKKALAGQFEFGKTAWSDVTVKIGDENFPSLKKRPVAGTSKVVRIAFSVFSMLNAPGQFMGVAELKINKKAAAAVAESSNAKPVETAAPAGDNTYADLKLWKPMGGQAPNPPAMSNENVPGVGQAVVAKAVSKGGYQGMEIVFPEPVDLSNVGAITFDFGQTVWKNRAGSGSIIIRYDGRNGLMGIFKFEKSQWSKVRVPIDLRTLKALAKQSQPTLGKVQRIQFSMFSIFDAPGESIGVANLVFEPKADGGKSTLIKVNNYRHVAKPTRGDKSGKVLTDGKVEEADQAMFRQYADNPDMVFDLGALYWVDRIEIAAVAVPGQNISDYSVYTSNDDRQWRMSANVRNQDTSTEKKSYNITGKELSVVGRFIRIKCERSRTDFPLNIAEVRFFGKIPTDEELTAVLEKNYEIGPDMPEVNAQNYVTLDKHGQSLKICRRNGVAVDFQLNGKRIAERIFSSYELNDGKNKIACNSYTNQVKKVESSADSVTVTAVNSALPGVEIIEHWFFDEGKLARRIQYNYQGGKKYIAYSALEVVLNQDFRNSGVYETWGAGHEMQHKFAGEVAFDFPADTGAVVVFESPKEKTALLAYRYKYNDKYIHIGSGTVTVAGFGDKRTVFTANGFRMGDGIWLLDKKGAAGSVTSHLLLKNEGDLTTAFDEYLQLSEVKKYRSTIKRPEWLKNWRLQCGQGWDGYFAKNGQRYAEHMADLVREGYILYGACDSDWAWGDFPVKGEVRNLFGGRLSVQELQERDNAIRKSRSNIKVWQYTWLWSCSKLSKIYSKHPEWFISHDADGRELSFFPGCGINYYRLVGIPESADEIVKSITDFVEFYNQDIWYLDGGGSPATVDWKNLRLDPPNAWDNVLNRVRASIQKSNPERVFFCNHPENPVADFGYLESFGGVITTNWRDGATWMYKFKLWQRADKLVNPLYIYWLGGAVDAAFRQYAVGTGLGLTFGGSYDKRRDAALISAWPQSRWARLVKADIKPNWRYEPNEMFEIMPLTFGPSGWLFIKNHEKNTASRTVSALAEPLGLTDKTKPVYNWCFTLRDHAQHRGLLGEKEREANYRRSRWASDFLLDFEYLGASDYASRIQRDFSVKSKELKLWYVTQSPALVWSVDEMRNQLLLDNTMGVKVSGKLNGNTMDLTVDSERKTAEIAALIPNGKYVAGVKVNGQATAWNPAVDANTRLVLIPVKNGRSNVTVEFADAAGMNRAICRLEVKPAAPGKTLTLALTPAMENATLVISNNGDMVWAQQGASAQIVLPTGVTGGKYLAAAYDGAGNLLAEKSFTLANGRPALARLTASEHFPQISASGEKWASTATKGCGTATADPVKRTARIAVDRMPSTAWGHLGAGFECELKRYVKIRLSGNLWYFNVYGLRAGLRGLHVKWDNPATFLGMIFDFAGADGKYNKRVLAGAGRAQDRYNQKYPDWGAYRNADIICSVSNFAVGTAKEETFWLDMHALGAPADWNGKVFFSVYWSLPTPDRNYQAEILDTQDELPAGCKANEVFNVRGGKSAELQKFQLPQSSVKPRIDGVNDDEVWKKAVKMDKFYRLSSAGLKAPATTVKMIRDQEYLYILAELQEPNGNFSIDKNGKPWFNDGMEIYIRSRDSKSSYVQYIFALAEKSHQEKVSRLGVGAPRQDIDPVEYKIQVKGDRAVLEAAIPLKIFGQGAKASRFNIGRNRMVNGNLEPYSLAGGKEYLNFDVCELIW